MKKIIKLSIVLVLLQVACSNKTEELPINDMAAVLNNNAGKLKRYDVKSGMVTYKMTTTGTVMGSTITGSGTSNLYFKDWGAIELVEENTNQTTKMNLFGKEKIKKETTHTINKLDNGKSYSVNFKNASIYLRRDPMMELMKNTNTDAGNAGKEMLKSVGGKKVGEENFLGYPCEIWDAMGAKQWVYKGISLKTVSKIMGITTTKEAISVKFDIAIEDSNFVLPDFPVIKDAGYLSDDAYKESQDEMKVNKQKIKNMTFEEFKQMTKQNPEMQDLSDEELKQQFQLMKKMMQ